MAVQRDKARNAWAWDTTHNRKPKIAAPPITTRVRPNVITELPKQMQMEQMDDEWVEIEEGPVKIEVVEDVAIETPVAIVSHARVERVSGDDDGSSPFDARYQFRSPWPDWVQEFREHQIEGLRDAREAFANGAELVFMSAPTGAGKTLLGEAIRREMGANGLYVCSGKTLQDQFLRDFPYAQVLKGRSNYQPTHPADPDATCADCNKHRTGEQEWECDHCEDVWVCPYTIAKKKADGSEVAVVNTTYMLHEANYTGEALCSDRDFVVVDEADMLEGELMRFTEFSVGPAQIAMLGLTAPKKGVHHRTIAKWLREELVPAVEIKIAGLPKRTSDVKVARRRNGFENLKYKALKVALEIELGENSWIRDNDAGPLVLKPIEVSWTAPENLWRHGDKWLLMSATLISVDEMVESLGVEKVARADGGEGLNWEVVEVPMTFPVENRRIHAVPAANMVSKEKATAWPEMCKAVDRVLERHPGERVLVHCVSFDLGRTIARYLGDSYSGVGRLGGEDPPAPRAIITYDGKPGSRDRAIAKFQATEGAVLIGASLERGVDFKGDQCRVVIVAKVPFPYLGDKQVAARANAGRAGRLWYAVQTVRTLVQMTGRGVRSEDDWCVTYILDKQFVTNIYERNRVLFPRWWRKALRIESRRYLDG